MTHAQPPLGLIHGVEWMDFHPLPSTSLQVSNQFCNPGIGKEPNKVSTKQIGKVFNSITGCLDLQALHNKFCISIC